MYIYIYSSMVNAQLSLNYTQYTIFNVAISQATIVYLIIT